MQKTIYSFILINAISLASLDASAETFISSKKLQGLSKSTNTKQSKELLANQKLKNIYQKCVSRVNNELKSASSNSVERVRRSIVVDIDSCFFLEDEYKNRNLIYEMMIAGLIKAGYQVNLEHQNRKLLVKW